MMIDLRSSPSSPALHRDAASIDAADWRRLVNLIGITAGIVMLLGLSITLETCLDWCIADWMITYRGGLVRRGLIGEALLRLAGMIAVPLPIVVVVTQIVVNAVLLCIVVRLARQARLTLTTIAIVVSPAFILSIVDVNYAARKETLALMALGLICVASPNLMRRRVIVVIAIGLGGIGLVLTHEMTALAFPYLVLAIHRRGGAALSAAAVLLLALLIGATVAVRWHGDAMTLAGICAALMESVPPPDCVTPRGPADFVIGGAAGSLAWLTQDAAVAVRFTQSALDGETIGVYLATLILAAAPLIAAARQTTISWRSMTVGCIVLALLMTLGMAPLIADTGRLIRLHIFALSMLWLLHQRDDAARPLVCSRRIAWALPLLMIGYPLLWRLPHFNASMPTAFPVVVMGMDWVMAAP